MDKRRKCNNCRKEYTYQRKSSKFCCDVCRVQYQYKVASMFTREEYRRLSAEEKRQLVISRMRQVGVDVLAIIDTPAVPQKPLRESWHRKIELYCQKAGCRPEDLIDTHKLLHAFREPVTPKGVLSNHR